MGLDPSPIVSEVDLINGGLSNPEAEKLPQVELSEFTLGPRFSGDPNGASKLDWSVFTREMPENQSEKSRGTESQ